MAKLLKTSAAHSSVIILLISLTAISAGAQKAALFPVGVTQRSFHPSEPYNWRGAQTKALVTTIWYPAGAGTVEEPQFVGSPAAPFAFLGSAAIDAKLADFPAHFPMILLSHGTGGTAATLAWLGTALASHGYVAAAVNHPGNDALEPYTTQGFILWWERARDLTVVIDQMLVDPMFAKHIDAKRIAAAGFSLGGYTMIEIAGGITEPSLYRDFCKSPQADGICTPPPEFPDFIAKFNDAENLAKSDPKMLTSLHHASDSYRDPRVRAVFAMAPALGPAFQPASLRKISIRVAIVAGTADQNVPIASSAQLFAKEIPHARLTLFPGVAHYAFLFECGETGKRARPAMCVDAEGIDRAKIHQKTIKLALAFFADTLK
jgi:predicted dienelactone hydrolase